MTARSAIEQIELYRLAFPLIAPWETAYGTETVVETLFVHATGAEACGAWFESCPLRFPSYMPECASGAFAVVRDHLAPRVLGAHSPAMVADRLSGVRGNTYARNLLEGAAWALSAATNKIPFEQVIGAADASPQVSETLSLTTPLESLLERIQATPAHQIRFKFTGPGNLPILKRIRERAPAIQILIDCNGAFGASDQQLLQELDQLQLAAIEQPLHYRDLVAHARLQESLSTPICLDESITCPEDAETAISLGSARILNLKAGRVGGITNLKQILQRAADDGIDCFIGGMLESHLGTTINQSLAKLPGINRPSDLPAPALRYAKLPPINFCADDLVPFVVDQATISG